MLVGARGRSFFRQVPLRCKDFTSESKSMHVTKDTDLNNPAQRRSSSTVCQFCICAVLFYLSEQKTKFT